MKIWTAGAIASVLAALTPAAAAGASCESLTSLKLSGGAITAAHIVPAGGFAPPGAADKRDAAKALQDLGAPYDPHAL